MDFMILKEKAGVKAGQWIKCPMNVTKDALNCSTMWGKELDRVGSISDNTIEADCVKIGKFVFTFPVAKRDERFSVWEV